MVRLDASGYLHSLDGRLRVKVPQVKRSPQTARRIEQLLADLDGVTAVSANPVTGNVLVHFRGERLSEAEILEVLMPFGLPTARRAARNSLVAHPVSRQVAQELAVAACVALVKFGFRRGFRLLLAAWA